MSSNTDSLRVDLWLYRCRYFKTRSQATAAVNGGHVRVDGERIKPGSRVQPGNRIELVRDRLPYALTVLAIPSRRGPAAEARECYDEDETTAARRAEQQLVLRQDRLLAPRTAGRPDKHTRRRLIKRQRG